MKSNPMQRGFTLIELLVVIAILAALSDAVVLVHNPAELLKQARDNTRLSDLTTLSRAIALYFAEATSTSIGTVSYCTSGTTGKSTTTASCTARTITAVDGTGWVTVDFRVISGGSPLSRLPMDPNNGSTNCGSGGQLCFYQYIPTSTVPVTYEINAAMESAKYAQGGTADVESNDGGDNNQAYEVGTAPGLGL